MFVQSETSHESSPGWIKHVLTVCLYCFTAVELEILTQLRVLHQQQSQILQLLQKLTNTDTPDCTTADLRAMFPITEEEGLADLELQLSENPDLNNRLVRRLIIIILVSKVCSVAVYCLFLE